MEPRTSPPRVAGRVASLVAEGAAARGVRPSSPRRGGANVLVLGVAFVTTVIAVTVLSVAQMAGRTNGLTNDAAEAEVLAESAVEYAQAKLAADPLWRVTYTSGVETTPVAWGRGTISFKLVDEADGNLANNTSDPVRVYGFGRVGKAVKVYSINNTASNPLSSLKNAVASGGNIDLGSAVVTGSGTISSNGTISALTATLNLINLEATGSLSLGTSTGTGTKTPGVPAKQLPDATHAFDYYIQNGTSVPISSFPTSGTTKVIRYRLFSPFKHPLSGGTANPNGIYVIDCQGWTVQVSNCRVVGTLVLLNTTSSSSVQGSNLFAPLGANNPSLLVKGDISISPLPTNLLDLLTTGDPLGAVPSINFNPIGTPYKGISDTTYTTTYPSEIDGLVYVSGNLQTSGTATFNGAVLVGGTVTSSGTLSVTYDASAFNSPPPGFFSPQLSPVTGSWRWEQGP